MKRGYSHPVDFVDDDSIVEADQGGLAGFEEQQSYMGARANVAVVDKVYSDRHTCDITAWTGARIYNVPVMTKAGLINDEVYGILDLPAVGDHVVVMFLDGDRPVILGTIIPYLYPKYQSDQTPVNSADKAYTSKLLAASQEGQYKRIFKSGATMQIGEEYVIFETPNGFYINIHESDTASSRSFKVEDPHGNIIECTSNGLSIKDKNASGSYVNKITFSSSGIKLEDVNGNTLELNATGVQINGTNLEVLR